MRKKIALGLRIAENTVAYTQSPPNSIQHIVVVGDSTAVGVGASDPKHSISGLIGKEYPNIQITNLGVSGAKVQDVFAQLDTLKPGSVDCILIQIGGNDIVRFTDLQQLEHDLELLISTAQTHSKHVVVMTSGNVGTATIFPAGTRWIFGIRTRQVREVFLKATEKMHVQYVDLYKEKNQDPFAQDPVRYYAKDSFHPSSDGYAVWYTSLGPILRGILITPSESTNVVQ